MCCVATTGIDVDVDVDVDEGDCTDGNDDGVCGWVMTEGALVDPCVDSVVGMGEGAGGATGEDCRRRDDDCDRRCDVGCCSCSCWGCASEYAIVVGACDCCWLGMGLATWPPAMGIPPDVLLVLGKRGMSRIDSIKDPVGTLVEGATMISNTGRIKERRLEYERSTIGSGRVLGMGVWVGLMACLSQEFMDCGPFGVGR